MYFALDDSEKHGVLKRIEAKKKKGKVNVQRFKGLCEMNPLQLRETAMARDTRRLAQLSVEAGDDTNQMMDMLLAKNVHAIVNYGWKARGTLQVMMLLRMRKLNDVGFLNIAARF